MTQTTAAHPLFDPASRYGQMRATLRSSGKMRGYFNFLWARAKRTGLPVPVRSERSREVLCLGREFTAATLQHFTNGMRPPTDEDSDPQVLDVWEAQGFLIAGDTTASLELRFFLLREAGGEHALIGRASAADLDATANAKCRAFLLEPEVVTKLRSAIGGKPLAEAFLAEPVADDSEVARMLASAPELEGEVSGGVIAFQRMAMPDQYETFPPRRDPPQIVVIAAPGVWVRHSSQRNDSANPC